VDEQKDGTDIVRPAFRLTLEVDAVNLKSKELKIQSYSGAVTSYDTRPGNEGNEINLFQRAPGPAKQNVSIVASNCQ